MIMRVIKFGIGMEIIDFPLNAVGVIDPGLVLHGVAARGGLLHVRLQPCAGQPDGGGLDLVGGLHLDSEVVERSGDAFAPAVRILDEADQVRPA